MAVRSYSGFAGGAFTGAAEGGGVFLAYVDTPILIRKKLNPLRTESKILIDSTSSFKTFSE
jgi:hypothetical protein